MLALVLVTVVLVFLGGALSEFVFSQIGLGDTTAAVWRYARWPAALLAMILIYAVVYFAAPERGDPPLPVDHPGRGRSACSRGCSPRSAFFVYVANFGSYQATYGAFAGAVILLVWLWLTNVVLLFGAELNAVIDLRRSPAPVRALRRPAAAGQGARGRASASTAPAHVERVARAVPLDGDRGARCAPPATSTARGGPGSRRTARGAGASVTA